MTQAVPGLEVVRAQSDADLEAMIAVRTLADPGRRPPPLENLRHNLDSSEALTYHVALLDGEPAGCGFVDPGPGEVAQAHCVVVPALRCRGIGSELLAALGSHAEGRAFLQSFIVESDTGSLRFAARRGYEVVGGERAVTLELDTYRPEPASPPDGIDIVRLSDRPALAERLYDVGREGAADIPGSEGELSFDEWRAVELDRPSCRHDLYFVALADGAPVGYAWLDDFGVDARNGLTAVRRAWRRRGIATALKRTQIEAAREAGFRRLITASEERNVPMSALNAKLGYRPDPDRSTLTVRGPADVRLPNG